MSTTAERRPLASQVQPPPGWEWEPDDKVWIPFPRWQRLVDHWKKEPKIDNSQTQPNIVSLGLSGELNLTNEQFFVRDSYAPLFERICAIRTKEPIGGILLTGQPGIGKSYWLLYAMIRLIQQGNEPFMLYFTSQILLFYNDVVFQMNPLGVNITVPSRKGHYMFMLIDTDLQRSPPPDICTSPNVFPVHAASPNPVHYSAWMGQYPEAVTIGMPLWSYEELYAAFKIQGSYIKFRRHIKSYFSGEDNELEDEQCELLTVLPEKVKNGTRWAVKRLLKFSIAEFGSMDFGSSARDVYSGVFNLKNARTRQYVSLNQVNYTTIRQALPTYGSDIEEHSHRFISLIPNPPERYYFDDTFELSFKSKPISDRIFSQIQLMKYHETIALMDFCRFTPAGSTFSGRIFEVMAHYVLSGDVFAASRIGMMFDMEMVDRTFSWTQSSSMTSSPFSNIRRTISVVNFDAEASYQALPTSYFMPESPNDPLLDSLAAHYSDEGDHVAIHVWVFQMTLSNDHTGSERGYKQIQSFIEAAKKQVPDYEGGNAGSEKTLHVNVHYVLVVPEQDVLESRSWKIPQGWKRAHKGMNVTGHCLFIHAAAVPRSNMVVDMDEDDNSEEDEDMDEDDESDEDETMVEDDESDEDEDTSEYGELDDSGWRHIGER